MAYQGPNVSVTQKFQLSPPAVAIEDLPSGVVGTAYDVYEKESLGDAPGLTYGTGATASTARLDFGSEKVIFDHTVAGRRAFDFYPPQSYVRSAGGVDFEVENEDVVISADGIKFDTDDTYPLI